ncbi:MAG: FHA domain-containing protein [Coriobacteriia bacterium]|nr:FHA domain-containing protein [Coriobacteriia bacterium]
MVDVVLLFGRILLIALLYLFLFATVRAGLGLIKRGAPGTPERPMALVVTAGPPELTGIRIPLDAVVRIGRAPGHELVIADDFVSTNHARIVPAPGGPVLEDLDSTNGTVVNGRRVTAPVTLSPGDSIEFGTVKTKVSRL